MYSWRKIFFFLETYKRQHMLLQIQHCGLCPMLFSSLLQFSFLLKEQDQKTAKWKGAEGQVLCLHRFFHSCALNSFKNGRGTWIQMLFEELPQKGLVWAKHTSVRANPCWGFLWPFAAQQLDSCTHFKCLSYTNVPVVSYVFDFKMLVLNT